jgi:hypothetical protein
MLTTEAAFRRERNPFNSDSRGGDAVDVAVNFLELQLSSAIPLTPPLNVIPLTPTLY